MNNLIHKPCDKCAETVHCPGEIERGSESCLKLIEHYFGIPYSIENEQIDKPARYDGDECMKAIELATKDLTGPQSFCIGTALRYLWRWKKKGGIKDLEKAQWYINRCIQEEKHEV